jgi:hypothetical protein
MSQVVSEMSVGQVVFESFLTVLKLFYDLCIGYWLYTEF